MSEFKYACPYCGQHIRCDSSQSGSVMECPTCLQQITAPHAPDSADQKLILTGSKISDRPKVPGVEADLGLRPPGRSFPVAALALMVLIAICGAVVFLYHGKLFHFGSVAPVAAAAPNGVAAAKPEPPVVVPHASDTNWTLGLEAVNFPTNQAAGRIHGQDFLCQRAGWQNGALTLRQGTKGNMDFGLVINFSGVPAEALAGQDINVTTNAPLAARVTLRWRELGQVVKTNFNTGYALRLAFGSLTNNHLPGKIYFCLDDNDKSYVAGTFVALVHRPKAADNIH